MRFLPLLARRLAPLDYVQNQLGHCYMTGTLSYSDGGSDGNLVMVTIGVG